MRTVKGMRVIYSFRTSLKQNPNTCHGSLLLRLSTRTCFLCRDNRPKLRQEVLVERRSESEPACNKDKPDHRF